MFACFTPFNFLRYMVVFFYSIPGVWVYTKYVLLSVWVFVDRIAFGNDRIAVISKKFKSNQFSCNDFDFIMDLVSSIAIRLFFNISPYFFAQFQKVWRLLLIIDLILIIYSRCQILSNVWLYQIIQFISEIIEDVSHLFIFPPWSAHNVRE